MFVFLHFFSFYQLSIKLYLLLFGCGAPLFKYIRVTRTTFLRFSPQLCSLGMRRAQAKHGIELSHLARLLFACGCENNTYNMQHADFGDMKAAYCGQKSGHFSFFHRTRTKVCALCRIMWKAIAYSNCLQKMRAFLLLNKINVDLALFSASDVKICRVHCARGAQSRRTRGRKCGAKGAY